MGVLSDSMWALTSGIVVEWLRRDRRWMRSQRYISGGILISLGVGTALAGSVSKK